MMRPVIALALVWQLSGCILALPAGSAYAGYRWDDWGPQACAKLDLPCARRDRDGPPLPPPKKPA